MSEPTEIPGLRDGGDPGGAGAAAGGDTQPSVRPPQYPYLSSRWSRLPASVRAGVLATFTGVAIFIGARIADRHSCVVLNSSTTTRVITVGSASSRPSRWLPLSGQGMPGGRR